MPWGATFAGLAGSFVGIGLARFAYTPLIPALIAAGWFSPAQAAYLGAANLGGYLVGAFAARPVAARVAPRLALRAAMVLAAVAFFACAQPLSFAWFFIWRALAGAAGGILMVVAAPTVLAIVPPGRRGSPVARSSPASGSASRRPACWCRCCCGLAWPPPGSASVPSPLP